MNPKSKSARQSAADGLHCALLLGLAWIFPCTVTGQSDSCGGRIEPDVYFRTAETYRNKDGFFQHCGNYGPPPNNPPKVYLRSTRSGSESYQESNPGVEVNMSGESSEMWTYHTNRWQEGALVTEFSGSASVYVDKYGSEVDCTFTSAGGGIWLEDPLADPYSCLNTTDTNCCEAWKANGWEYYHNFMTWTDYCEGGDITHKVNLGTLNGSGRNCYVRWDDILSIEYTTELLIGFTIADVSAIAYGSSWQTYGTAYTILSYDSTYGYPDWKCNSGKMEYQLRFSSLANTRYLVEWDEVTLWDEGGVSVARMSEYVQGNGGEVSTATHERLPPTQPGFVFVSNGKVTEVPPAPSSPQDNDCQGCGTGKTEFGGAVFESGQLLIRFGLGQARFGEPAGELLINQGLPSWILANPKALRYFGGRSDVELISSGGALRQVKAPQGLADIVPNPTNAYAYNIRFFFNPDVLSKVNGLYLTTNSPLVSWTIENPDGQSSTNRLQITENGDGGTRDYLYNWDAGSRTWVLFRPENMRIDEIALAWDASGKIQTETLWIRNAAGQPVEGRVRKHQAFRFDSPYPNLRRYGLKLVEERRPAAGGDEVSTYLYDSSTFQSDGRLPLRWMIQPSGYWEYYEYTDPNESRRLTRKIAQFLNEATNSVPSGINSCRVTLFEYSPTVATPGSGDTGTVEPFTPRRTIETLLGQEVARSYVVLLTAERRDIRCQTPLAAWNAADNLVTVTRYYPAGDSFAGKVRSVDHPDGTRQVYFYSTNTTQMATVALSGAKDAANSTNIVSGTRTTSVIDLLGRPVSQTTVDKVTPSIVLSSETFSLPDDYGRPQRVTYLDGTFADTYYSCCGIDQTIDRDGATTQFSYDALGRQVASTRFGITITNILDAAGNVLQTRRIGTDQSTLTLAQAAYDQAGQLTSQTNALGGRTTFAETKDGSGQTVRTTTAPDGGTRIETFYKDGQLKDVSGTSATPVRYIYGLENDDVMRPFTCEIKLTVAGTTTGTNEWTKTYSDLLGRPYKTLYAGSGSPYQQNFYNNLGQLWKTRDPDGVLTLYQYDGQGRLITTATDMDQDSVFDRGAAGSTDRVRDILPTVTTYSGMNVRQSEEWVFTTDSSAATNLVSVSRISTDGLRTWNTVYRDGSTPVVTQMRTVFAGNGNRYVTNTAPDGSYAFSAYAYGRLVSVTRRNSAHGQIGQTLYGYDTHGRQATVTDARNGASIFAYNAADLVTAVTTPPPGTGQPAQTTLTHYNAMLQATNVVQPDGASLTNEYYLSGLLRRASGDRNYPVGYGYDAQGRMTKMTNWTGFASGAGTRVTTWNHDPYRGWLSAKRYADNYGPDYAYKLSGRLQTRTWARGSPRITTTYGFNNAGDLSTITYANDPSGTPNLSYTYDRRGRRRTVTQGSMVTTFHQNYANQLTGESHSGGTLGGLAQTNLYNSTLRRTDLALKNSGGSTLASAVFGYDNAGRLSTVSDGTFNATYSYLANSALISQILLKTNTTTRMTVNRQHDLLNRLSAISSSPSANGQLPLGFDYRYNDANQRVRVSLHDGSFWVYEYDRLGQVISGKKYWSDWTPVPGQQFEYGFDDIGNRTSAKAGGDSAGGGLRSAGYTNNVLNQLTSRGVPGAVDVLGLANRDATVTVNSQATWRRGEYFHRELAINNASAPQYTLTTVQASQGGTNNPKSGYVYLPRTPESFGHDLDGNLTNDGRWAFTWDAENRLIRMEPSGTVSVPSGAKRKLDFQYDAQGRRIQKAVCIWTNSAWSLVLSNRFLYDGWNLVAELNATNNNVIRSYVWGLDLSGSEQGAGGVGGLLVVKPAGANALFPAYDGNGNVMGLVDGTTGTLTAQYEYGPFGEPIRVSGAAAALNPFRFSTKYTDDETDLVYYGYRYYVPSTGRWLSRDPIEESGGVNVYAILNNSAVVHRDYLGLSTSCDTKCGPAVTRTTQRVLQDVESAFIGWDTVKKLTACNRLHGYDGPIRGNPADYVGRLQLAQNAWDILELAYHTPEIYDQAGYVSIQPFGEPERCKFTVAFAGRCYFASQVNYILWGRMHRLCNNTFGQLPEHRGEWSLDSALWYTTLWKTWKHGIPNTWSDEIREHVEQAMAFTRYGFDPAIRPEATACKDCRIQPGLVDDHQYHWTWLPYKTRDFVFW